jgi:hypothetical protein
VRYQNLATPWFDYLFASAFTARCGTVAIARRRPAPRVMFIRELVECGQELHQVGEIDSSPRNCRLVYAGEECNGESFCRRRLQGNCGLRLAV